MKRKKHSLQELPAYPVKLWIRAVAMKLVLAMVFQIVFPSVSMALTSGPQQPEASNFTPADVSNLVDPFTGDFSYNIPMFDVGGYPINLSYNSGISMDQEATWVGLGWNLNTGAITRDVRGLPDDFWGDEIVRKFNTKPNITAGGSVTVGAEISGFEPNIDDGGGSVSYGLQLKYNNYTGFSLGQTLSGGVAFPNNTNIGLGLSTTNGGLDINPTFGISTQLDKVKGVNYKGSLGFGLNINSRTGLSQMNLNASVSAERSVKNKKNEQKTDKYSGTAYGGGSISFVNNTYIPQLQLPYQNFNFSGRFKIGGAVSFGDLSGTIAGFYAEQKLMTNEMRSPSYGYVYSQKGQDKANAVHDFNREKDGEFTTNTPSLPLTNYTYDAFNINAQGIGGSFRAFRNETGHVFDQEMYNPSIGGSFGAELDLGATVDFGVDVNINFNESKSGKWTNENLAKDKLRFTDNEYNSLRENVFFKTVGELVSESDETYKTAMQNNRAVAVQLQNTNVPMALNQLTSTNANNTTLSSSNTQRGNRLIRNTNIQCLTLEEVKRAYPVYLKYIPPCAKGHHIVMIIATTVDGTRYVFGLPAYNKVKKEVTFAIGKNMDGLPGNQPNSSNNVSYNSQDASISNTRGIDNYYDETITPAYVHTWYLTEVLSPDYSDITGDGPSPDDLGGYVLFKYGIENPNGTVEPQVKNYKWRTPTTGPNLATFNKGLKSLETDDKATYLYGLKDIWYPNSIESKTQIAVFEYSDREDGLGVTGEHGSVGGSAQKKIDKIRIYSRHDKQVNTTQAVPNKTIHFEYTYALCPNTPNSVASSGGKLTLSKVFFTYKNSEKARYNAYVFEYPTGNDNPAFSTTKNNRWGSFQDNMALGLPGNEDFPYVYQNKQNADLQSRLWNLKAINLPTGGKIQVEYESDDYAYVQNKKACRMFLIKGAGDIYNPQTNNLTSDKLFKTAPNYEPNEYLYFDLETPITTANEAEAHKKVQKLYLLDDDYFESSGPHQYLYFRFLTNVNKGNSPPAYEYVSGYADLDVNTSTGTFAGVVPSSNTGNGYTTGWVKLKKLPADGNSNNFYHPISKAGWAFSRINTPFYAHNQPTPGQSSPGDFIKVILNSSVIVQLIDFFRGPNNTMRDRGFSNKFIPNQSYIRLYEPDGVKYGGGHRVKKILISDNWNEMEDSEDSFEYGQEYLYTDDNGIVSSGVASFEPLYGADENPFRIPVFYDKENGPLIPDDRFYQEEPFGESFFPAPHVGYSRVIIRNLQRTNVTQTATGYTVNEFYTAKDFPTVTRRTNLQMKRSKIDPLSAIISPFVFDYQTASQGFVIELNNMHGKPKREMVFQENNHTEPISEVRHFYQLLATQSSFLNNSMNVLEPNGEVKNREIGTEMDMVADFRESNTMAGNIDIGFNTDYMQLGPIPLLLLIVFPKVKVEETRFRSASVTKVISRYAIEVKTEAYDLGSKVSTENVLFNGISGEPLVTRVNNEYDDDRYTLSVPAYWAYPGMKQASTNEGFMLYADNINNYVGTDGKINLPNAENFLEPGDEAIYFTDHVAGKLRENPTSGATNHSARLWVAKHSNGDLYFIKANGDVFTRAQNQKLHIKIIRSGHRNILTPKIAEFSMLEAPVTSFQTNGNLQLSASQKILSVTATTFHEQWKTVKRVSNCEPVGRCVCTTTNAGASIMQWWKYVIENNLIPIQSNVTLPLYTSGVGYLNGFNEELLSLFISNNCNMDSITTMVVEIENYDEFITGNENLQFHFATSGYDSKNNPISCNLLCDNYELAGAAITELPNELEYCNYSFINHVGIINIAINEMEGYLIMMPSDLNSTNNCLRQLRNCNIQYLTNIDAGINDVVNPYIHNILGKWRPYESYTLIKDRSTSMAELTGQGSSVSPNLRDDGFIQDYVPFWYLSNGNWTYLNFNNQYWKRTTTMTEYHPSGPQVEEKNALDIYSSALFGYFEQLAIAVVQNARFREIGYDGFEDYAYLASNALYSSNNCIEKSHFKFDAFKDSITDLFSHTGRHSIKTTGLIEMQRPLQQATTYRTTRAVPYALQAGDIMDFFGPDANSINDKEFVFSFWAKQSNYLPVMFDFTEVAGDVLLGNTSLISTGSLKKSPIIEGWQKFEYRFVIPSGSTGTLKIQLKTLNQVRAYIDDVRIHPFNSLMKSYVYDPLNLQFMAELDENNFATFYEYDEDGALIRIKKETERGIMTIQENRYSSFKRQ